MSRSPWLIWLSVALLAAAAIPSALAPACCPAPVQGQFVVNADQTVIMVWNPETKTQHFIRQASFASNGKDFGFIVPTPSEPDLQESGDAAFELLKEYTKPEVQYQQSRRKPALGCGCSASESSAPKTAAGVEVLQQKRVAGFDAVVLEATSATELVEWLNEHGYEFSPEVEAWAKPYVDQGWKFTALQVAKEEDKQDKTTVDAAALRISFQTERPLFPYREPDMTAQLDKLNAKQRLLRIFFLADKRYAGELTKDTPWTGQVAWSGKFDEAQSKAVRERLALPGEEAATWWLTEFEDNWPYRPAPADLYFAASDDQSTVKRPPIIVQLSSGPLDAMPIAIALALLVPALLRRRTAS